MPAAGEIRSTNYEARKSEMGKAKQLVAAFLAVIAAASRPAFSDEVAPLSERAIDIEFASAVEGWIVTAAHVELREPYRSLVDRLDAERYADRNTAGAKLLKACTADPDAQRWLLRARAVELRPEARYWLNRILRQLNRCETCEGLGYCAMYQPRISDAPDYGVPCRRCGRTEWQHGAQWNNGGSYEPLACADCGGSGTYWNHYAVD